MGTIQLTSATESLIRQQVESGRYATAEEVIAAAIRLLDEREQRHQQLRAKLQVGIDELDRGEGVEWTPERMAQLSREADEMYLRGERPDPDVCP